MFLLHFLSEFVLYNLHLVSILNQVNFTLPLAIHTINKKNELFLETVHKVRYKFNAVHNGHPQSFKISVICFGALPLTFLLPLINEFYLPNQMKILRSDINTENMN